MFVPLHGQRSDSGWEGPRQRLSNRNRIFDDRQWYDPRFRAEPVDAVGEAISSPDRHRVAVTEITDAGALLRSWLRDGSIAQVESRTNLVNRTDRHDVRLSDLARVG